MPFLKASNEFKSKPAQNALKDLRGFGIIPDVVAVRAERNLNKTILGKIALFSGISEDAVVALPDVASVYDVPLNVLKSGVLGILNDFVGDDSEPDMSAWEDLSKKWSKKYSQKVKVGLVAKYVGCDDTYICVTEALKSAAVTNGVELDLVWINAEEATDADFASVDGLVVPGGFGARGVDGKICAADFALREDKPYLGLCLGLQVAVIAAAKRGGLNKATSEELEEKPAQNVIYLMPGQAGKENTGGSMRLGDYDAKLVKGSLVAEIYGVSRVTERHRHRYEVNQKYLKEIKKGGLEISGLSPDGSLVEFVEAPGHKFMVATQAHPEFRSRPMRVHPLFDAFVKSLKK